mmetsp:Transcript_19798/g.46855  ORF Transcript_19798/g.46855 Transcript_19798/m.46855 type:complete len:269 (+) Transcript_19798:185-991(+)|eukprot:CAMPEP_0185824890 /NCGR_PEP_ID=MMETSP1322-20130828/30326_1 /TAXON_ID=265543 /ORGANISM="Minutocellus polymorphus, Strain RCC2270" /LENGTH=268 /DNA_ID=CAMNT_0028522573 /DNA_START=283 /DNA_END=1089 /DNA_ORIENTATION=-
MTFSERTDGCLDVDGTEIIVKEDRSIFFVGLNGGSGGGGSSGCRRGSCGVPSACYDGPIAGVNEFAYNQQLKGGTGFAGQGNPGGHGDVLSTDDDQTATNCAGGGGGAGGRGEDAPPCFYDENDESTFSEIGYYALESGGALVETFAGLPRGAAGGVGADLSAIVGSDLGDEGYFGGGGAAKNGIPGKGGGGCGFPDRNYPSTFANPAVPDGLFIPECMNPNRTEPLQAVKNTGGGGGPGYRDTEGDETSYPGGSGIVIITFDACGCS